MSSRVVSDSGVPGGQAIEISTPRGFLQSWDAGLNWATAGDISKDDTVLLAFWAKGLSAANESQTPAISPVRIQQSDGAYEAAAEGAAFLSRDWQMYYVGGKSGYDVSSGHGGVVFHLGSTKQTLRVGPAYLLNLGPAVDPQKLPQTAVTYEGRSDSASWRKPAMERIDRYRKATLTVQTSPGARVRIEQLSHDFNLGTFTNYTYGKPKTDQQVRQRKLMDETFNMLTLPMYWQDWGWNGAGSKEAEFRDYMEYAAEQGTPWRGHPILWAGENYMTTALKNASTAKQRKMVMDHVRESVSYAAKYKPEAIDLINEVRVNRYFRDKGEGDLIDDAFRLASELAPGVPLYVNDYGILNNAGLNQQAIDYYHEWIQDMQRKDVPVGGIGFQGHFSAGLTSPQRVVDILQGFERYGLPLQITEFDVETLDRDAQADYTRDMLLAAMSVESLNAFIFWGFWEGDHWKPTAAMVNNDFSPRPAWTAMRTLMYTDLWTDTTLTADSAGNASLRGMKGRYRVTVNGQSREVTLEADTSISF